MNTNKISKITAAGMLVTLGIAYGDIGTSVLYVLNAIIGKQIVAPDLVYGGVSCVFWTLILLTTIKYMTIVLSIDNNGVGGVFALYTLVRKHGKWLMVIGIVGGASLLADGIITPPISVSSAIEGLEKFYPHMPTIPIVIGIIIALFSIQQFGTNAIGKSFGPIMLLWFLMLGGTGLYWIFKNPAILKAVNPYYAYQLLAHHPKGFWLLGAVFLCTTGADSLYSDLSHCGRKNLRATWVFVGLMLLIQYFGQGAWLLTQVNTALDGKKPIFEIMPDWLVIPGIALATAAAIIACQALITGAFTLVNEAIRLSFWPKVRVRNTNNEKEQLYVPSVNWLLMIGCIGVVLHFKKSEHMEAAYGLMITITMITTTILTSMYLYVKHTNKLKIALFLGTFLVIELSFLTANLAKFFEGGWVSLLIGGVLAGLMAVWIRASIIKSTNATLVSLQDYTKDIMSLRDDRVVSKYTSVLIYLTKEKNGRIERKIIESILKGRKKRADLYVFVHIEDTDKPYYSKPKVEIIEKNAILKINLNLGFREPIMVSARVDNVLRKLVQSKDLEISRGGEQPHTIGDNIDDTRYVLIERFIPSDCTIGALDKLVMDIYFSIKHILPKEDVWFGIDSDNFKIEPAPLYIGNQKATIIDDEIHITHIQKKELELVE